VAASAVALPVFYLAWRRAGVDPTDQAIAFGWVLAATVAACLWGRARDIHLRVPLSLAILAAFPLTQAIPFGGATALASAERQSLWEAFARHGIDAGSTLSIYPYATLQGALVVAGCVALYSLSRAAASRSMRSFLAIAAVLLVLALAESVIGVHQHLRGQVLDDVESGFAHGTFVNRNHYASLLEGTLGIALGLLLGNLVGAAHKRGLEGPRLAWIGVGSIAALACLLGVLFSYSRMGICVVLMMLVGAILLAGLRRRLGALSLGALALAAIAAAGYAGMYGLAPRFIQLVAEGDPYRLAMWKDSLLVARSYLFTGSGLGTFAFAFQRSESYLPLKGIDHAHSDLLGFLVAFGLPGALLL
jgi:hypothetical protein